MADLKISQLTAITTLTPATDVLPVVDVTGTTKKITTNQILGSGGTATLASATISGDLTVDTSTLKVDSTNNRVGIGTASPSETLHISKGSAATFLRIQDSSSSNYIGTDTGNFRVLNASVQDLIVATQAGVFTFGDGAGGTRMTLNATGLGVGVASPDFKFVVNGTQAVPSTSGSSATDGSLRIGAPGTGLVIDTGVTAASAVYGWIQARLRTDYSSNFNLVLQPNGGNVGIGVTPSLWASGNKFIDINSSAAFGAFGASDAMMIGNAYWDGGSWIRKTANNAWRFVIESVSSTPSMTWQLAANGSAGSSILSWTQAMTLNASGNLLVARTGAGLDNTSGVTIGQASIGMQTEGNATQIVVNRTTSDGTIVDLRRNNSSVGNISVTTSGATFNSTSDYRLKESVAPLSGGLARVNALKPSIYKWKSDGSDGEGFLAHELAEVVPLAVTGEKDAVNEDGSIKPQGVDLSRVVPILVAAIQELTAEVNALKNA
jgi:hypothetical protein